VFPVKQKGGFFDGQFVFLFWSGKEERWVKR
jgi:hypothetical protein